jgi:hypothetical protein
MTAAELRKALAKVPDDTEVVIIDPGHKYSHDIKHVLFGKWDGDGDGDKVCLTPYGVHRYGLTDLEDEP